MKNTLIASGYATCPECASRFEAPTDAAGAKISCTDCSWTGVLPEVESVSEAGWANKHDSPRGWAESREPGCVARMLALAAELGLSLDDVKHWPHHIAAELAEGCLWDEELWARYDKREYTPTEDWHAIQRTDADMALKDGLEGVIAYLLANLWESSVEKYLRDPARDAHLTPEQMAQRYRLFLWAEATFPRHPYWYKREAENTHASGTGDAWVEVGS